MFRTLLQPRYAALSVLMIIVAGICVAAGTWQIARLAGKIGANDALRANAHAAVVPLDTVLPLAGRQPSPKSDDIQFRRITVTGTYDAAHQVLVRQRSVNDDTGFLVLTPLRTASGDLLVVRGFVSDPNSGAGEPHVAAPPAGQVTVAARIEPAEHRDDEYASLNNGQVESINPSEQSSRLGVPMYAGYGELLANQTGTAGLETMPTPDLSNPAGGAVEPQHLAYIIQWYLFAGLALAAPLAMARAETRRVIPRQLDQEPVVETTEEQDRAARLAARYGRQMR